MKLHAFKIARFFGIALLACAIVLLFINPKPENNLPAGFYTPIIAFEFIQTPQEVQHFFDVKDVSTYVQALRIGNWIDYIFMVLYSSLLCCIAIGIQRITKLKIMYFAMFLCLLMLLSDAIENYWIYCITTIFRYNSAAVEMYLHNLNIFTWLKWGSIASTFLLFSPFFLKGKLFHKIIGISGVACFGLCVAAFLQHGILNEIFATSVVLVFLLLVIFVFTFSSSDSQITQM